jgi:response regulator RpfG family c-di-GMP phosphodiesterase
VTALPKVVCIDDEPHVLSGIAVTLRRDFEVFTATSGKDGLALLDQHRDVSVVVSDMRMPGMTGAVVLARAREQHPDVTRVLLTGQADLASAIAAVNDGQVFRFLTKPCNRDLMIASLRAAEEHHRLVTAERVLLEQTLKGAVHALVDVLALTNPVTFGRANRIKARAHQLAQLVGLEPRWQVEMAALLLQIGYITLPDDTVAKLLAGHLLTDDERRMVARLPAVAEQLLAHIPRLEVVREMMTASTRPPTKPVAPDREVVELGGGILRVAIELDALDRTGTRDAAALDVLRGRPGQYDDRVVNAFACLVGAVTPNVEIREISLAKLKVGMAFAEDVKMASGALLVARGYEVTGSFLERVRNFPDGAIREPLRIVVVT